MINAKTFIRFACFASALLLVMFGFLVRNTNQTLRYRRQLELNYVHSLQELSSQLNNINADLQKSLYAGTPAQVSAISAKVWKEADVAKSAMGSLPAHDLGLTDAYRFLSQVGDYSMYLTRKTMAGEEITQEERDNYLRLREYAQTLSERIADMEYNLSSGQATFDDLVKENSLSNLPEAQPVSINLDDQQMDGYPTLVYDGPFSDHLLQHSPMLIQGETVISVEKAREIAAGYLGEKTEDLTIHQEENSNMPSYIFAIGSTSIGVTKAGGYVTYITCGREIRGRVLSVDDGLSLARDWLEARGIGAMTESYYELANGVLTINYAYTQEDVICYTDLIKVGVALDNGDLVFYDARGFISNHHEREITQPTLAMEEALSSLSPNLTPQSVQLALIPTGGRYEVLTYEFRCKGLDNEDVLVYVNVESGAEEQIFILIHSPNGTLAI